MKKIMLVLCMLIGALYGQKLDRKTHHYGIYIKSFHNSSGTYTNNYAINCTLTNAAPWCTRFVPLSPQKKHTKAIKASRCWAKDRI